ncbi:hypothetical protein E2320_007015 [Naja naja]|nr:hypothetical protein E2320_007015 [Naja naja]
MDAQLNPQRIWKPVPLSALKQIKQATADYGIHSHYTKALLEALGLGNLMIPADWKALFKMLLTPSQYVVFDFHYKQQALARGTVQIIPDQIYGSGQFTAVDQQKDLPDEAYPIIILAVFAALSKVEGKEGGKSFATIKQQNGENYGTFIDRLKLAIERQINNPQAQEELLLKLAVENANVDCKRLLTPLVASGSALDLAQLLEAAAKAGSNVYNMECMATAFRDGNKKTGNCFNCGKPGHFKAQCRAPGGGAVKQRWGQGSTTKPKQPCPKCKKGFHWANQCRLAGKQGFQKGKN